jgi:immunoglobulin-binding protein 1
MWKFISESWHVANLTNRYLAINHHLAELIQRIYTPDIAVRKSNILRARECYEAFLKQLDVYDILGASDCKLLEAYSEDKANFSTTNTRDAAARRDAKIARFRSEKELKRKLEVCNRAVEHCFLLSNT